MNDKPYQITALELGPMENFIYLIKDLKTQRTAVVDPAWEVDQIFQAASQQAMQITDVLLTHSHFDHINGVQAVLDQCDAQLHLLKSEAQFWGETLGKPTLHHGVTRSPWGRLRSHCCTRPDIRLGQRVIY